MFQSTHPHGVRHLGSSTVKRIKLVSIHAPTRGATRAKVVFYFRTLFQSTHPHGVRRGERNKVAKTLCFNPRTHTGCDEEFLLSLSSTERFNPRTHTGCDKCYVAKATRLVCFNPRTHTGCDDIDFVISAKKLVSIHAPTRGATSDVNDFANWLTEFQSTHPHGVRRSIPAW